MDRKKFFKNIFGATAAVVIGKRIPAIADTQKPLDFSDLKPVTIQLKKVKAAYRLGDIVCHINGEDKWVVCRNTMGEMTLKHISKRNNDLIISEDNIADRKDLFFAGRLNSEMNEQ